MRARGGDDASFGVLYERHFDSARRVAGAYASSPMDAEDLASEGFTQVLGAIRAGGGPQKAFRPYVLTVVRRLAANDAARGRRTTPTSEMEAYAPLLPFEDPVLAELEASLVGRAFAALPERWQTVLWHTEVEGESPAQVAPRLGLSPNAVAALALRAREGLRKEYLQAHLSEQEQRLERECRMCAKKLAAYLRGSLGRRDRRRLEAHLDTCDRCVRLLLELREVSGRLRGILTPLLLGPAFAGYFASLVEASPDDATDDTPDTATDGPTDGTTDGLRGPAGGGGTGSSTGVVALSAAVGLALLTLVSVLVPSSRGSSSLPRTDSRAPAPTSSAPASRQPVPPSPTAPSPATTHPGEGNQDSPRPDPAPRAPTTEPASPSPPPPAKHPVNPTTPPSSPSPSPSPPTPSPSPHPPRSVLADGSLETPRVKPNTFQTFTAGQFLGPWKVTSGSVDLKDAGYWQAAKGKQSMDLNGNGTGAVSQTFATVTGTAYTVTYALAGNSDGQAPAVKTGTVLIDGQNVQDLSFDATGKTHTDMGYVTRQVHFVATGKSTTLTFASTTPNSDGGPVIDDVTVIAKRGRG
ncbi:choice-of-anchor C family protein [Streptomyces sp. NRRL S-337]|uniref:choice-of-anchor C family protein n=1 Tax=Streptomyces sp. NRRL S-337 TaxID=1463900 RepID=UPI00131CAEAA|nr:choice-of-anchor C family protein [Streptomyces sp. NRRL S-337]